jgi:diguanylate cyclase (GGDEF)-like protein
MSRLRLTLQSGLLLAIVLMGALGTVLALVTISVYRDLAIGFQRDYLQELVRMEVDDQMRELGGRLHDLAGAILADPLVQRALAAGEAQDVEARLSEELQWPVVAVQLIPAKTGAEVFFGVSSEAVFTKSLQCPGHPSAAPTATLRRGGLPDLCTVEKVPLAVIRRDEPLPSATAQLRLFADPVAELAAIGEALGVTVHMRAADGLNLYTEPGEMVLDPEQSLRAGVTLKDRAGSPVLHLEISKQATGFLERLRETRQQVLGVVLVTTLLAILVTLLIIKRTVIDPLRRLTAQLRSGTLPATLGQMAAQGTRGGIFSLQALGDLYGTLREMAIKDPLTGLYNRALFEDKLEQFINDAHRAPRQAALVMLDLDRFKQVNDSLGHQVGDRLLQEAALRLSALLRKSDVLSRFGGDEFTLLIPDAGPDHVSIVTNKIVTALEQEFRIRGHRINVSVSVGVALFPEHGQDVGSLLRRADSAMYAAKHHESKVLVYEPAEGGILIEGLVVVHELRRAIKGNRLSLEYQPVIDARTGATHYFEALIRWHDPEAAQLSADELVRVAERNGLIRPLTNWLINEACRQLAEWQAAGADVRVGINFSMQDLHDRTVPDHLLRVVQGHDVDPRRLVVEITENGIMQDAEQVMSIVQRLAGMGVGLAIDDFGTGQASLGYLKKLPVKAIKIDKSFVVNMVSDEDDAAIVRATIDLAHDLGLEVTAEGVESDEIWEQLQSLGCDRLQGYYIARPLSAAEVPGWAAPERVSTAAG